MVLDDATNNAQDNWADDASPSADGGTDSADSRHPILRAYGIDVTKLPQPSPFSTASRRGPLENTLERSLKSFSREIRRPLTQAEAEAICYIESKGIRTSSWGLDIFTALGLARCYQMAATFRFPFRQPDPETFNPNSFFGIVRGSLARGLWHTLRAGLYGGIGGAAGLLFLAGPYASTVAAAHFATDQRLQEFNKDIMRLRRGRHQEILGRTQMQTPEAASQQYDQRRTSQAGKERYAQDDDMSPTSNDYSFSENSYGASDTSTMNDSQAQNQAEQSAPLPSRTTGASSSSSAAARSNPSSGSAWDRIRAQAGDGSSSSGTQPSSAWSKARGNQNSGRGGDRSGSDSGDSFSFSNADEDRELAKSEAQREFDARIERERHGRDF
ncbi:MAG: hypothetical protein M1821_000289 [Bathelium mastoideum]|nr:MAG: hypothetical protein M1821_000289 [Bathelium mastoideum]KAI9681060.1 MAG: hypothetical protein M1822_007134 [Bathelium mastoideum]